MLNGTHDSEQRLLQNGADPYMMNVNGVCPHDLAVQKNKTNVQIQVKLDFKAVQDVLSYMIVS